MKRFAGLLVAILVLIPTLGVSNPNQADAFWLYDSYEWSGRPDASMRYKFWTSGYRAWPIGSSNRARMSDAADRWEDAADDYVWLNLTINYSTSSSVTNKVGWAFGDDLNGNAATATPGCNSDGSSCTLLVSLGLTWYNGGMGAMPSNAYHLGAVLVHELGHWLGANHDCPIGGEGTVNYGPDGQAKTMCMGLPWTTIHQMTTPEQDDIAAVVRSYAVDGYMSINQEFNDCAGGSTSGSACEPDYWEIRADSNRFWWWKSSGNGYVSINNGNIAYPELIHHIWGPSVDADGDRKFYVRALVKGRYEDSGINTRAVLFVRHEDGSYEDKCDDYPSGLPNNQWTIIDCYLTVPTVDRNDKYEFGVRVTDKTDIDYLRIRDD